MAGDGALFQGETRAPPREAEHKDIPLPQLKVKAVFFCQQGCDSSLESQRSPLRATRARGKGDRPGAVTPSPAIRNLEGVGAAPVSPASTAMATEQEENWGRVARAGRLPRDRDIGGAWQTGGSSALNPLIRSAGLGAGGLGRPLAAPELTACRPRGSHSPVGHTPPTTRAWQACRLGRLQPPLPSTLGGRAWPSRAQTEMDTPTCRV